MANIDKELQAIQDAIYGEEVRSSIHDAIKAVNESATDSALVCETKASEAIESARIALEKALEILSTADTSKSYAVGGTGTREGEDTDNAKYYMKQAQSAASGLIPSGNVTFEQLMALTDVVVGAMYHVTNEFTTNDKFEDYATLGAEEYPAGTNVYMKVDGLWCTMVGSEVIGVKGNEEESYRTGHVNITKEDIGIVDATTEKAGIVKLSDSSAVTDSTGLALPATEKNATIEGTLANQLDILNSNFNNYEIKIITSTGNTSEVGTFSFNYTDELPNGGALFLIYTANSNYWCRLYGFSDGNCVLGIADFNMQNSANTQHTVYSYWLVKKVNRLFDSINPQF